MPPSTYLCNVSYQTFVMTIKCYDGHCLVDFLKDPNGMAGECNTGKIKML